MEYAKRLSGVESYIPQLHEYLLIFAVWLAEIGELEKSLAYCDALGRELRDCSDQKFFQFSPYFVARVTDLALRIHALSPSIATQSSMGNFWTSDIQTIYEDLKVGPGPGDLGEKATEAAATQQLAYAPVSFTENYQATDASQRLPFVGDADNLLSQEQRPSVEYIQNPIPIVADQPDIGTTQDAQPVSQYQWDSTQPAKTVSSLFDNPSVQNDNSWTTQDQTVTNETSVPEAIGFTNPEWSGPPSGYADPQAFPQYNAPSQYEQQQPYPTFGLTESITQQWDFIAPPLTTNQAENQTAPFVQSADFASQSGNASSFEQSWSTVQSTANDQNNTPQYSGQEASTDGGFVPATAAHFGEYQENYPDQAQNVPIYEAPKPAFAREPVADQKAELTSKATASESVSHANKEADDDKGDDPANRGSWLNWLPFKKKNQIHLDSGKPEDAKFVFDKERGIWVPTDPSEREKFEKALQPPPPPPTSNPTSMPGTQTPSGPSSSVSVKRE